MMRGVEAFLTVRGDELVVTGDVTLPDVIAGPALRGGEVTITSIRLDVPGGNGPAWSGTLSDLDEERARDNLMDEAIYRDMKEGL